jgi:hypothetical protein
MELCVTCRQLAALASGLGHKAAPPCTAATTPPPPVGHCHGTLSSPLSFDEKSKATSAGVGCVVGQD